ncbi:unnamed protein product [Musa acuminata subsp. malaccensis]|uniref:(wild Malaysian banana) hypothetical protein n=1 Tax=Musa acuminata subsp. malaccensis TaxID=214687 RepID=A0A8D7F2F2_MUSAM|nr:unnamed protein product [Musa acuminata subsp. malaccensis]
MSSLVVPNAGLKNHHVGLPVYLHGEEQVEKKRKEEAEVVRRRNGFCLGRKEVAAESSESSSIGAASSEDEGSRQEGREAKEEEVESKRKDGAALGSLDSLEDSLPIKQASFVAFSPLSLSLSLSSRGLSNFFSGKSKSFASLSDAATASAKDMAKPENPFNKRRRLLMMSNIRSASYTSLSSRDHTVKEADEEEEE